MPLDAAEFHAAVYAVVRLIPFGKATSYGHIAKLIGMPRYARHVGQALKFLPENTDVPWQRVISSSGHISSRGPGTEGAQRQREALEAEGVQVRVMADGSFLVDWRVVGWFPESVGSLPELAGLRDEDEEGEAKLTWAGGPNGQGGDLDLGHGTSVGMSRA